MFLIRFIRFLRRVDVLFGFYSYEFENASNSGFQGPRWARARSLAGGRSAVLPPFKALHPEP